MNAWALIQAGLAILKIVSSMTKTTADEKLTAEIEAAIQALQRVAGQDVYKAHLEKIEHKW